METPKSNVSPMNVSADGYKTRFRALRAEVKEVIKRIILAGGRSLIRDALEEKPNRPSLIDVTALFNDQNDDYQLSCKRRLLTTPPSTGKKKKIVESSTPSAIKNEDVIKIDDE